MSILIKNVRIFTPGQALFTADIGIRGQLISTIGTVADQSAYERVIDGSRMLAMPGLINTHGHAAMSLFRGFGDDMQLMDWLTKRIWPAEVKMTGEDMTVGSQLAIVEMIKSGTTCFADMYFLMERTAQAAADSGIRASLCEGMTTPPDGGHDKLDDYPAFQKKWQGAAEGRITTMLGPHAPYTCDYAYLERVAALARELRSPVHIHLAETKSEVQQLEEAYGLRPVPLMDKIGLFDGVPVLAAHGVYIAPDEMAVLADKGVSVAHNPRSNMKLASGIAPVAGLLRAGVNVSLGTDSACSNNNLDMFQELRTAALLAKVSTEDPTVLPAAEALKMATVNGARALGLDNVGELKEGMQADIILLDLDQPHFQPPTDLESHLVYAASGCDVDTVIVAGKLLMEKRQLLTLDEEKIIAEADQTAKDLLSRARI